VDATRLEEGTVVAPAAPLETESIMSERELHTRLIQLALVASVAATAACGSDGAITPPPPPPPVPLVTISGVPAKGASLQQLGIAIDVHLDSALIGRGTCRFEIDGTASWDSYCVGPDFIVGGPIPSVGAHTAHFTYMLSADSVLLDTTFTFATVAPKIDAYTVAELAPLSGDVRAVANDMNETGVVVGSSFASDGTSRPVRWVAGQPSELANPDNAHGTAVSVNADGTIVGTLDSATVVWTTSGSIVTVTYNDPPVRINDAGQVLTQVWSHATDPHYGFLIYDVAAGTAKQVATSPDAPQLRDLNRTGQVIGADPLSAQDGIPGVYQYGGVSIPVIHAAYAPHSSSNPLDLTDSGEILAGIDGWLVFGTTTSSVALNPFFGGAGAARANNNDVVAGTGPDSEFYLWHKSANISERVDVGAGWTFDSVVKLNDNGAILAHGANSSTGQSGSVVLTPMG